MKINNFTDLQLSRNIQHKIEEKINIHVSTKTQLAVQSKNKLINIKIKENILRTNLQMKRKAGLPPYCHFFFAVRICHCIV